MSVESGPIQAVEVKVMWTYGPTGHIGKEVIASAHVLTGQLIEQAKTHTDTHAGPIDRYTVNVGTIIEHEAFPATKRKIGLNGAELPEPRPLLPAIQDREVHRKPRSLKDLREATRERIRWMHAYFRPRDAVFDLGKALAEKDYDPNNAQADQVKEAPRVVK